MSCCDDDVGIESCRSDAKKLVDNGVSTGGRCMGDGGWLVLMNAKTVSKIIIAPKSPTNVQDKIAKT